MRLIDADKLIHNLEKWSDISPTINERNKDFIKILKNEDTVQAIPIPDNATNGDMIRAMFPDLIYHEGMNKERIFDRNLIVGDVFNDSWNAPYKGGSEK